MTKKELNCHSSFIIRHLPVALALYLGAASYALGANPREELEQTQKDMKAAEARQAATVQEEEQLKNELKPLQDKLVKTAEATQKTEFDFSDAQEKLRILNDQVKDKNETLKTQKQRFSALMMTELSLSNTPPEAMLMMPQDPLEIMKAARALNMATESIRKEALNISQQLQELNALQGKVTQRRDELATLAQTLDQQRHDLTAQIADRSVLQKKLGMQQKQEEETLAHLAKKSSDLKDLVTGIEKEEVRQEEAEAKHSRPQISESERGHLRSFEGAKGHIRAPAAGQLVQKFGASLGHNSTSKGVTIATRSHAEVTAPYDGEVVFTGPFLTYGQMVILHHSDDFHTLVAGLSKIDVEVGQFLLEGEPIGAMGDSDNETKNEHSLYIELRKDNQPVDPALWITGLSKK